jgi:hypothetical protein
MALLVISIPYIEEQRRPTFDLKVFMENYLITVNWGVEDSTSGSSTFLLPVFAAGQRPSLINAIVGVLLVILFSGRLGV